MQNSSSHNLKLAEKGVWISIFAYIILSIGQIAIASLTNSESLKANGFNNMTDILGNIAILIGMRIARIPADNDHVYGHWKIESIASLISSFIMFFVGFELLRDTVLLFIKHETAPIDPLGAVAAGISSLIMLLVYLYNKKLAKATHSQALLAASKDNLSDAWTSIGTVVAIIASATHLIWLDKIMAMIICIIILKTAFDIFKDSVFTLSDGFDESLLDGYKTAIELTPKVKSVKMIRGRNYGSNIFLDVVIDMNPDLSVSESHAITENIEKDLMEDFGVYDVDVHVEPSPLADEERKADRSIELLKLEEKFLNNEELDVLIEKDNFTEILADGRKIHFEDKIILAPKGQLGIKNYKVKQVSKRTFILNYTYFENDIHYITSSIWRRNELWYCIYRQTTVKK